MATVFIEVAGYMQENAARYNSVMQALKKAGMHPTCASGSGYYGMQAVKVSGVNTFLVNEVLKGKKYFSELVVKNSPYDKALGIKDKPVELPPFEKELTIWYVSPFNTLVKGLKNHGVFKRPQASKLAAWHMEHGNGVVATKLKPSTTGKYWLVLVYKEK